MSPQGTPTTAQQYNHPRHLPCSTLFDPLHHPQCLRNTKSPCTTASDTPITRGRRTGARHSTMHRRPVTVTVQRRRLRRRTGRRPLPCTNHTASRLSPLLGRRRISHRRHDAGCPCPTRRRRPTSSRRHQACRPCVTRHRRRISHRRHDAGCPCPARRQRPSGRPRHQVSRPMLEIKMLIATLTKTCGGHVCQAGSLDDTWMTRVEIGSQALGSSQCCLFWHFQPMQIFKVGCHVGV